MKIINAGCLDRSFFKNHPPPPFGVLLLQKEEIVNVLIIYILPSFSRRGIMTARSGRGGKLHFLVTTISSC